MRKRLRRILAGLLATMILLIAAGVFTGCTTTIRPPADVQDPLTVYVLDHGHTPSLLMPSPEGGAVRYAYGDWTYYAEGKRNPFFQGLPALLWPTDAAVGRQDLAAMPAEDAAAVESATRMPIDQLHSVVVDRARAESLHRDLEDHFRKRWDQRLHNPSAALTFVPHDERYSLPHDSNHMVAHWLEQMGAQTTGPFWAINWKVEAAE